MLDFNNNRKIITLDHRERDIHCYFDTSIQPEVTVFTDGSFNEREKTGAFSVIFKNTQEHLNLYTQSVKAQNNNEVELRVAIKALEMVKNIPVVLLYTDSRYVKKGITEWIFYWQIND